MIAVEERLERILRLHFDPEGGSRYWLERQKHFGFSVTETIHEIGDLWKLGPMPAEDLAVRPVEDFIPESFLRAGRPWITAETGGATGKPKTTAYFEDEFREIFVLSFLAAARPLGFPVRGPWLWIGPGGPHVIGKAAHAIAREAGGRDAFSVDFDPRWYRRLAPGSVARSRYLDHLVAQALDVVSQQRVRCLFSTPVVLTALAAKMPEARRRAIGGIYFGGMALDGPALAGLRTAFPAAILVSGYGNTLFGVCHSPQDLKSGDPGIRYFPQGPRLHLIPVRMDENLPDGERIRMSVAEGEKGQVMFHRLDESFFLPNVLERDAGIRIRAEAREQNAGFSSEGVLTPQPLRTGGFKVEGGIY